jgi:hypothetical protein
MAPEVYEMAMDLSTRVGKLLGNNRCMGEI